MFRCCVSPRRRSAAVSFMRRSGEGGYGTGQHLARRLVSLPHLRELLAVEFEHKQPNRRRQIPLLSFGIDRRNQVRQGHVATPGDLLQPPPELILEAHARLMTSNDDGAFDDGRLHADTPVCCTRATSDQKKCAAL